MDNITVKVELTENEMSRIRSFAFSQNLSVSEFLRISALTTTDIIQVWCENKE